MTVEAERLLLVAAITRDATAIARTGYAADPQWRAAARRIATNTTRLDQLEAQDKTTRNTESEAHE